MRLLLDTHVLLWALAEPRRLTAATKRRLDDAEVFASAASIWEIAIKRALGKLDFEPRVVLDAIEPAGFSLLPVTGHHAAAVAELPPVHRDPFDRMLIAQARVEPMTLLTNDGALSDYGERVELI